MTTFMPFPQFASSGPAVSTTSSWETCSSSSHPSTESFPMNTRGTTIQEKMHRTGKATGKEQPAYDLLTARAQSRAPLNPTMGIEIEFILCKCIAPHTTHSPAKTMKFSPDGCNIIREALAKPLVAACSDCGKRHKFWLPLAQTGEPCEYSTWKVSTDPTIDLTDAEGDALGESRKHFNFYAIELQSRVLSLYEPLKTAASRVNPGHRHRISYQAEVDAVLERLNATFNQTTTDGSLPPYRIIFNQSCGYHAHVGNGEKCFPLQTVKNMKSTSLACEPAIDSMMASDRIGASAAPTAARGMWNMSPSEGVFPKYGPEKVPYNHSLFAIHAVEVYKRRADGEQGIGLALSRHNPTDPVVQEARLQYTIPAAITLAQRAEDVNAFHDLTAGYGHCCSFNTDHLHEFMQPAMSHQCIHGKAKHTVEFRQHASTLDAAEVLAWLDFLVSMTLHAHNHAAYDVTTFFRPDFTAIDLLHTVGCAPSTLTHYMIKISAPTSLSHIVSLANSPSDLSNHYHDTKSAEGALHLRTLDPQGPWTGLLKQNLADNLHTLKRSTINARMLRKLLAGGYGQLPDAWLARMDFSFLGTPALAAAAQAKLRVGYVSQEVIEHDAEPSPTAGAHRGGILRIVNDTGVGDEGSETESLDDYVVM